MTLGMRLTAGLSLVGVLVGVCGGAGYYGAGRLSKALNYITGPAWDAADGGMETSIQVEAQMIAAMNVAAGVDLEKQRARLDEAKESAREAFARLEASNILPADDVARLREAIESHEAGLVDYLASQERFNHERKAFEEYSKAFLAHCESMLTIGAQAVDQLKNQPEKPLIWNVDLKNPLAAATGSKACVQSLLSQLKSWERLAGGGSVDEAKADFAKSSTDQRAAADSSFAAGYFDVPVNEGEPLTYREAFEKLRSEHERLQAGAVAALEKLRASGAAYQAAAETVLATLAAVEEKADGAIENEATNIAATQLQTTLVILGSLISSLLVAVGLGVLATRTITRPIRRASEQLEAAANQVAGAAGQLSGSSQSLAEGSSQQAAAIEQTSASLEELAAMTERNAANAQQANQLALSARDAATQGTEAMNRVSAVVSDMKQSADKTAGIVKTIDEIAFQTNLLALNAAVEAARAGDAGKGFAVVAEEVRNLAQRSAAAAKDTAALIEESRRNADNGVAVALEAGNKLGVISDGVVKVTTLIGEVTSACKEQSLGISQINKAIAEMDKVTQSNAANSEEAAAASEELNAQAYAMSDLVVVLSDIVGSRSIEKPDSDRENEDVVVQTFEEPGARRCSAGTSTLALAAGSPVN